MAEDSLTRLRKILHSLETRVPKIVLHRIETIFPSLKEDQSTNNAVKLYLYDTRYQCKFCNKSFRYLDQLNTHKLKYHDRQTCNLCGSSLLNSAVLAIHMKTLHSGEQFVCDICKKSLASSYSLVLHKRTHTGEKPYLCNFCGKDFAVRATLLVHQRIHTGERPYECDICNDTYPVLHALKSHILGTHLNMRLKSYSCKMCRRIFTRLCDFTRHRNSHH